VRSLRFSGEDVKDSVHFKIIASAISSRKEARNWSHCVSDGPSWCDRLALTVVLLQLGSLMVGLGHYRLV